MRGSEVDWPADDVSETPSRTGGSRLLLDELFAERERAQASPIPPPVLSVDPVVVPQSVETGRRALRQRLAELENAARRNYRSAEEARRVLADEHHRLEQELSARTHAQHEAAALRREVERLSTKESRRSAQERNRAERAARAQIADELKQFQEEHESVLHEMTVLRSALSEHDGLLDEYVTRLRDEQGLRAELRAELDRAQAARSRAERSLQRATENARHGAEDEMIRLATAEQQLADACSDRDRLSRQLAELTAGDGPIGRMTAQLEENDAEIGRLQVRLADLGARIDASEEAAQHALAEREEALAARSDADARYAVAEQARADAEHAAAVASARSAELEAELAEHVESTGARTRELDRTLGNLRKEARQASAARRAAEEELAIVAGERDELRTRVHNVERERDRLRSDGDQLRAHSAALGDELAATRAARAAESPAPRPLPAETDADADADVPVTDDPPPLPLRVAGRHAPAPQLARRRPRPDAGRSESARPDAVRRETARSSATALAALQRRDPESPAVDGAGTEWTADAPPAADPVAAMDADTESAPAPAAEALDRRSALAEFSALATSGGDDFTFRRR